MLNKAVIDLRRLKQNAINIKKTLNPNVKFCAVVKADAYGHGAEQVANALYGVCDFFAVAICEEGIKLRLSGIDKSILVLTPPSDEDIIKAVSYNLTLTVASLKTFKAIEKACKKLKKNLNVHIKYNTGMNRFGVDTLSSLKNIFEYSKKVKKVKIEGIYSHFSNPNNDLSREKALKEFLLAIKLAKSYNNNVICHISASGGYLKNVTFDMVRIGLLLYGYKPFPSNTVSVKPVMKVFAPVVRRRTLRPFESALYGDKKAVKKTKISIVRFGYADGLNRCEVRGQFNNRCMDVTAVKGYKGKYVNVLKSVDNSAKKYKTISYEILTKATLRAEKIYKR